ncbi:MAG: sialate O-acetylesterase [Christensenellaceae bacterium]
MDGVYHKCFGPEVGMAEYLSETFPDETIYLIKFAVGGSSLKEGWTSESRPPVNYNYQYFKNVANSGLKILSDAGLAPRIVGLCWMQGEADAESTREAWSLEYGENLAALVSDLRMNFNAYAWTEHTLNFIDAYISNSPDWTFYKKRQRGQASFRKRARNNVCWIRLRPILWKRAETA